MHPDDEFAATAPTQRAVDAGPPRAFGEYEILAELGRGGMGVVYRARHRTLDRVVALKVLTGGEHAGPEAAARFVREAGIAARLEHPNIVAVHDAGVVDGQPYYTMSLVEGLSLRELLDELGLLPPRAALQIAADAARGLAHAHAQGVVHRDVKPENILLAYAGAADAQPAPAAADSTLHLPGRGRTGFRVLGADFGLARQVDAESKLTRSGAVLGTLHYMAPEQAQGDLDRIGPWSDVYSLGATLYEMLCGAPPFAEAGAESPYQLLRLVVTADPPPLRARLPALHPDLDTITTKALEKQPARRFADAQEMAAELRRYLAGEAILSRPRSRPYRLWRWLVRRRAVVLPAATLLLALSGMALHALTRPGYLVLRVRPAGARVTLGRATHTAGERALRLVLRPGRHRLRITSEGYEPAVREEYVGRNETREIGVTLERQTGFLSIDSVPRGDVWIDGERHGTPLLRRRLPIGPRTVWVERQEHYGKRLELLLERRRSIRREVHLTRAEVWSRNLADWGAPLLIDADGDGVLDLLSLRYALRLRLFSGRTGQELWSVPISPDQAALGDAVDADGDGVLDWIACHPEPGGGFFRMVALSPRKRAELWSVRGLAVVTATRRPGQPNHAVPGFQLVPDLDGDGASDILTVLNGPELRAWSSRDGRVLWRRPLTRPPWDQVATYRLGGKPLLVLWDGEAAHAVDGASGALRWTHRPAPPPDHAWLWASGRLWAYAAGGELRYVSVDSGRVVRRSRIRPLPGGGSWLYALPDGRPSGLMVHLDGERTLECWDVVRGRHLWRRTLEQPLKTDHVTAGRRPLLADTDGRGLPEIVALDRAMRRIEVLDAGDGRTRWRFDAGAKITGDPVPLALALPGSARQLCLWAGRRVWLLDAARGAVLWRRDLPARVTCGGVVCDHDGDGKPELLFGTAAGHLVALDGAGAEQFRALVRPPIQQIQPFDIDRDGLRDFLVQTKGGPTAVRGRKVIWRRTMANAVRPAPVLYDVDGDGTADVILPVYPPGLASAIAAFDGKSGATLWSAEQNHDMIRRVALADLTGDGVPELLTWSTQHRLRVLDVKSGRLVRELPVPAFGYAEPAAGDLDGDGTPDVVTLGWAGTSAYGAVSGRTGKLLWRGEGGRAAWSGATIADVTGDGRPEVLLANNAGLVLALHGATGKPLWSQRTPAGNRAGVATGRIAPGQPLLAAVNCMDGQIYLFDARTGNPLLTLRGAGGTASRPLFADANGDGRAELIAGSAAGLLAIDLARGTLLWKQSGVISADPVIGDLDRDGRPEVLAGTMQGELLCVDLRSGKLKWAWSAGSDPIEGAVALADADGDGVLDVFVTGHDGTITCLTGRGRIER